MRWVRRIYDWMLSWADRPHAGTALFGFSFIESSFFPIPPDVLMMALCMGNHKKWVRFAAVTTAGSVLGAMLGYGIGYFLGAGTSGEAIWDLVGKLTFKDGGEMRATAERFYTDYGVGFLLVAAFTPIPFKVFTIGGGFFHQNFLLFVLACLVGRAARFFLVSGTIGLLYEKYGEQIQIFIDKYFNWLTLGFMALLIAGFMILRFVGHG